MAVGIACESDVSGYSYTYKGVRYCYLETTNINWDVGQMPSFLVDKSAQIIYIYKRPYLDIHFNALYSYNIGHTYVDVNVTISNLGSETSKNTVVYVGLQTIDTSKVWDSVESEPVQIAPEEGYEYKITNLHAPGRNSFRIYVLTYGDNAIPNEAYSDWVVWE
ncbi:hypothetical protein A3K72_03215 [Candidatus Woesearchaeota archaeon RBG_13_36_6]|nr:MAG: hypothetical protein A3K72_03215 [Candidatus Woesearchaeota archaeon RBG_13_36_6]